MRLWLRYFFVVLTAAILLGGTVFALLMVRGNTITPSGITQTGTIRLDVSPPGNLTVLLNEQRQNVTSNGTVENINPGEYTLKISKDGYRTWQQPVKVQAGLVTNLSAKLFPEALNLEQITQTSIAEATFAASGQFAFYIVTESPLGANVGIWRQPLVQIGLPLIEERAIKISNITPAIAQSIAQKNLRIIPAPNGDKLLLLLGNEVFNLAADKYSEPGQNNRLVFDYRIDQIDWLSNNSLLIQSGNLLIEYNLERQVSNVVVFQNDISPVFSNHKNGSSYVIKGGQIYRYNDSKTALVELENIVLPQDVTQVITPLQNEDVVLLVAGGNLYYLYIPTSYLTNLGPVGLLSVSPNGQYLFVKDTENKILSVQVNISLVQNTVGTSVTPTSIPSELDVNNLKWDSSSRFVLYQTNEPDKLFSADRLGQNISLVLLSENILPGNSFSISPNGDRINLLLNDDKEGSLRKNLYQLELVN